MWSPGLGCECILLRSLRRVSFRIRPEGSIVSNRELSRPWKPNSVGDNGVAQIETTWGAMTAVSYGKSDSRLGYTDFAHRIANQNSPSSVELSQNTLQAQVF